MSKELFDLQKTACLSAVDLSRKGSIDAPILDLVEYINGHANYFTTSSCSGRIIVVDNDSDGIVRKQGCKWILASHERITLEEVIEKLKCLQGNAVFKFEPFVMHVQCRTLEDAQLMLSTGVGSGYRNSGISVGNKGKFITAIRSTHSMEVPLSHGGDLLVSEKYLKFLVETANKKMEDNIGKIERFFKTLKTALINSDVKKTKGNKGVDKHHHDKPTDKHKHSGNDKHTRSAQQTETEVDVRDVTLSKSESYEDLIQCAMFTCDLDT